ncbi:MAG TPA: HDOD domain-containing protein [Gammaproteobacteria bacterium]|nr:HDOD domain-containing protein [Gammaproteobacteria bacterium]
MEIPHVIGATHTTPGELISQTTDLVSLPDIYVHIKAVIYDPDSTMTDVSNVLSHDPAICARMLKVANSAFFGATSKVETVKAAVRLLGTQQIHDLVLAATITKAFPDIPDNLISMEDFWVNSVRCGLLARLLAEQCNSTDGERFFVGSLLHDMGHLIMYQTVPEESQEALISARQNKRPLYMVERDIIGCDYGQVGSQLMQNWNFPENWIQAVRYQNEPADAQSFSFEASIMHLSARITGMDSTAGELATIDPIAWEVTGLSEDMIEPLLITADEQLGSAIETFFPEYRQYA